MRRANAKHWRARTEANNRSSAKSTRAVPACVPREAAYLKAGSDPQGQTPLTAKTAGEAVFRRREEWWWGSKRSTAATAHEWGGVHPWRLRYERSSPSTCRIPWLQHRCPRFAREVGALAC